MHLRQKDDECSNSCVQNSVSFSPAGSKIFSSSCLLSLPCGTRLQLKHLEHLLIFNELRVWSGQKFITGKDAVRTREKT
jgi:hypothetical protein